MAPCTSTGTISMKFASLKCAIACVSVLAACPAAAQQLPVKQVQMQVPGPKDMPGKDSQAASLATLKGLVDDQNYSKMGFLSLQEVASAALGVPVRRYIVRPGKLKSFKDKVDPATVIEDTGQWIFPVVAGNAVRCAITIAWRKDSGWKATSFGDQGFARTVFSTRLQHSQSLKPPSLADYFLVDVLSARQLFVAWRTDNLAPGTPPEFNKLMFTWVGQPPAGFDKVLTAETALNFLAQEALKSPGRGPGQ